MKLLIIDDHAVVRDGLAALLRQAWPDAAILEAGSATDGLMMADAHADLDAVLLDLHLPGMDGRAAISEFVRRRPELPVVVLSVYEEASDVRQALTAGARGYVPKSANARTLLSALQFVLAGNIYVPPLLIGAAALDAPNPHATRSFAGREQVARLTARQLEVLKLITAGLSNKDIGRKLGLQDQTVKTHITAIFKALGVVNRTQAANAARQTGLIADDVRPRPAAPG